MDFRSNDAGGSFFEIIRFPKRPIQPVEPRLWQQELRR
jgi:hypothetical protein